VHVLREALTEFHYRRVFHRDVLTVTGQSRYIKRRNVILWNEGSSYRAYVFKESIRHYAINRKGRGRKEVIYLRVANISCTRGVRKSTGLSYGGPCGRVPCHFFSVLGLVSR